MKKTHRFETIARRQRSGRRRDLFFVCFVASISLLVASTIGAAVAGAAPVVASAAQR